MAGAYVSYQMCGAARVCVCVGDGIIPVYLLSAEMWMPYLDLANVGHMSGVCCCQAGSR